MPDACSLERRLDEIGACLTGAPSRERESNGGRESDDVRLRRQKDSTERIKDWMEMVKMRMM